MGAVGQWLERLSSVQRHMMRKFAAEQNLQSVHVEILQYLSICNRYSDTTQALSEYLGQTKGSISQSLRFLEDNAFLKRVQDKLDKRVFHLLLTAKGLTLARRWQETFNLGPDETKKQEPALQKILLSIQKQNGLKSFGVCHSCHFNQNPEKNVFTCGLTGERLSFDDIEKICREHLVS